MNCSYKILGTLYSLLGECEPEEFVEAAHEVRRNRELSDALLALAAAARRGRRDAKMRERNGLKNRTSSEQSPRPLPTTAGPESRRALRTMVSKALASPRFSKNADLAKFLDGLKLGRSFRPRDGRQKMIKQALTAMDAEGRAGYIRALEAAGPEFGDSQTAGWLEVIREGR